MRPLAPRLSVYRWRPHMVASILHRGSGIVLVLLTPLYLWLLHRMTASPDEFVEAAAWLRSGWGRLLLFAGGVALVVHYANGIRFLLLSFGVGETREGMRRGARLALWAGVLGAIVLGVALA